MEKSWRYWEYAGMKTTLSSGVHCLLRRWRQVWEENHAQGLGEEDMRNKNFERQGEQVVHEMIGAHYNHPCIYIWGILNECASDSDYGKDCYRRQFELIRSLDDSRPCSFASCKFKTDRCFGLPGWCHKEDLLFFPNSSILNNE